MARTFGATAWSAILNRTFPGNMRIRAGRPRVIAANAAPSNGSDVAKIGTLWWYDKGKGSANVESINGVTYICAPGTLAAYPATPGSANNTSASNWYPLGPTA